MEAYFFNILMPICESDEPEQKNCEVMVYNTYQQAYEDFINELEYIFKDKKIENKEYLSSSELDSMCESVKQDYFKGYETKIAWRDEDIKDIDIKYWRKIVNSVYGNAKDEEGYYHSAISNFKSKYKRDFQIYHIKPISKGGLTETSNLQLLSRKEDYTNCENYLNMALKINNKYYDAIQLLADVKYKKGNCEEAVKLYDKAIELNDKNIDAFNNMGYTYC